MAESAGRSDFILAIKIFTRCREAADNRGCGTRVLVSFDPNSEARLISHKENRDRERGVAGREEAVARLRVFRLARAGPA